MGRPGRWPAGPTTPSARSRPPWSRRRLPSPTRSSSRRSRGTRASASAPTPTKHDAAHSTREQSGVDRDDADLARRLEEGNRAYEDRFGRVFIVRAAGRSGTDILEHLQQRLDNSDELERAATIDQLTQIAVLRMKEALS